MLRIVMRVLHVISSLNKGGAEKFVVDLVNATAEVPGNDVILLSFYANKKGEETFFGYLSKKVAYYDLQKKTSGFSIVSLMKLIYALHRIKPDIVNSHTSSFGYVALASLLLRSAKYFHTVHSVASYECGGWLEKLFRRKFFGRPINPIGISEAIVTSLTEMYGMKKSAIPLVVNGVPFRSVDDQFVIRLNETYRARAGYEKVILAIGRIDENKNHKSILKAVIQMRRNGLNVLFMLAGRIESSDTFRELNEIAREDKGAFEYVGVIDDTSSYYAFADFFCISSFVEGVPITVLEAFSMRCVVLTTPAGGVLDVVRHGDNGFITSGFEYMNFVTLFQDVMSAKSLTEVKDRAYADFHEYFHIKTCALKYIEVYSR